MGLTHALPPSPLLRLKRAAPPPFPDKGPPTDPLWLEEGRSGLIRELDGTILHFGWNANEKIDGCLTTLIKLCQVRAERGWGGVGVGARGARTCEA